MGAQALAVVIRPVGLGRLLATAATPVGPTITASLTTTTTNQASSMARVDYRPVSRPPRLTGTTKRDAQPISFIPRAGSLP